MHCIVNYFYLNAANVVDVGVHDLAMNAVEPTVTGIVALPTADATVAGTATKV